MGLPAKTIVGLPLLLVGLHYACDSALDIPLGRALRNIFMSADPVPVAEKYQCTQEEIARKLTIVVTVKDACSQAPGFIRGLQDIVPPSVHLIYTYPNFTVCADLPGMKDAFAWWDKATVVALPLRVSPMQGWKDAAALVTTPYSLLLHNDGYALNKFFACEIVSALEARSKIDPSYVIAAPFLMESKADKSLASHATQSNLRLVMDDEMDQVGTIRHDHSISKALNRGEDFEEGEQMDFLEDHGFLMESDKIAALVDPYASYTLEYIDMIMTIKANHWKVLFVPTARLEFRITEFSWRDIPYFMYKRSEVACHQTRDYIAKKWGANVPNTGFWTYIKYTIVEQFLYDRAELSQLKWSSQASVVFGFYQMAGYNRYILGGSYGSEPVDYVTVLEALDSGYSPAEGHSVTVSRNLNRRAWSRADLKETNITHLSDILNVETRKRGVLPRLEADMRLEYLPFAIAHATMSGSCDKMVASALQPHCGIIVQHEASCVCAINLPTFKMNGPLMSVLQKVASLLKVPSRVTTYLELFLGSETPAAAHVSVLQPFTKVDGELRFELMTCEHNETACAASFMFPASSTLVQFAGRPPSSAEVAEALAAK
jgi:hypothetical protein